MTTFAATLATVLLATTANAHVLLTHPAPRVVNDYLFSFASSGDTVCNGRQGSCDKFCGHRADDPDSPITELEVGTPIDLKWLTNVAHSPGQYRLALNSQGDGDIHFDDEASLLTVADNAEAADPGNKGATGSFTTSVTIPERFLEHCSDPASPCALQLYDLYYFVSCANVVLVPALVGNSTLLEDVDMYGNTTDTNSTDKTTDVEEMMSSVAKAGDGRRGLRGGMILPDDVEEEEELM